MKKVYLFTLAFLITGAVSMGQNSLTIPSGRTLDQKQISKIQLHQSTSNAKSDSRWYCYGETMDLLLGGIAEFAGNYIFPDSTMQVVYSGGVLAGTWIHKVAEVVDPSADFFNDATLHPGELYLPKTSSYTLDSIQFCTFYMRGHKTPTAVDTLLVEVAVADYPGPFVYFPPSSAVSVNLSTDTVKMIDLAYTQATNSFGVTPHTDFKIPLTAALAADTLDNGLNVINIAPNLTIGAGQHFYVSYSFVPGYTWTPNADSMAAHNSLRLLSLNEGPGNFPTYTKNDWNVSYILPQDVRYDAAGSWNGSYIPSFAYMGGATNTYDYIHHYIFYKCTGVSGYDFVSVPENETENGLSNAYPNPVAQGSLIIPVKTNDPNAVVIITDMLGQEIMKFNKISNGQVVVNTSGLNAGLYFYTLHSGKNTITKKFTVVK
ncbi:MAG TPA: T9SS type A sorting domain-containing protein [Bacteroidales bacterium]|nr:T9SS type A sorting domain-containing protein [Bacteroidales bacterium]